MTPLTIELIEDATATILVPHGDVNLRQSPKLRAKLTTVIDQRPPALIVDLSDVPFMDSSGIATLVEALQRCRRAQCPLVLCALQDRVRSVFEIARLETVFTIHPTRAAAIEALLNG